MKGIYEYVKDKHGHRRGVVYAVGKGEVGWSLCNHLDRFNRDLGIKIAQGRAINGFKDEIPNEVRYTYEKMKDRAKRYYK